jgi:hypothetical protein
MERSPGSGRARAAFVERAVGSETIVYDRETHRAHCLGPVASAVRRSLAAGTPLAEIPRAVEAELGEPVGALEVELALRRLSRAGLVDRRTSDGRSVDRRSRPDPETGRRAALRRVATLTGLAVVSLVVPTPEAAAASCTRQLGQTCTSTSECCPTQNGNPTCCGQRLRRCLPVSVANCGS